MKMVQLDDRELISLYLQGNETAFKTLLMRHKSKIYRFIMMKINDTDLANDIFQETFIKVVNTLKYYPVEDIVKKFFYDLPINIHSGSN